MLRIDFVSDVNCPWCALGLTALDAAIARLGTDITIAVHCQPFELNPQLPVDGIKLVDYLQKKYGMSTEQIAQTHNTIHARGAELGFEFAQREFIWNSFNSQRLLYWIEQEYSAEKQLEFKRALVHAYQGEGRNINDTTVLLDLVNSLALDKTRAQNILASDEFTTEVRAKQQQWINAGINAVPSVIINNQHLVQGAQSPETYEQIFRELAAAG
ncbi:DsbA family oxidoreductase [Cellvibrio mixtus]|uniref:DsbA family oxidoreductase n=1 Tax=Cellvibrio mixtus TaxID=39650 RepID=UPI000587A86A|nr:DsbA family oxidoreductase [Cellvibrio mixtus]